VSSQTATVFQLHTSESPPPLTGLVHDLHNQLTSALLSWEDLCAHQPSLSAPMQKDLHRLGASLHLLYSSLAHLDTSLYGPTKKNHFLQLEKSFSPFQLLQQIIWSLEPTAHQKKVTLTTKFPECATDTPNDLLLYGPPILFQRAIFNLILNAIEAYSPTEDISLTKQRRVEINTDTSSHHFQVNIIDQAGELSAETLTNLGKPGFTTKPTGHGLGLWVSKKLISENFKGTITYEQLTSNIPPSLTIFHAYFPLPSPSSLKSGTMNMKGLRL
jgi:signal transduction histidine kinase